MLNNIANNW